MPYRHPPELRALLVAADAARKVHRQAAHERGALRAPLAKRVRLLTDYLARALERRNAMKTDWSGKRSDRDAAYIHGQTWRDTAARIEAHKAALEVATAVLTQFDTENLP